MCAALALPSHARDLAGEYTLHGMRETASALYLSGDGRFTWSLSHGRMDQVGQGHWTSDGRVVVLENDWSEVGPRFHRYVAGTGILPEQVIAAAREIAARHPGQGVVVVIDPMMGGAPDVEFALRYADGSEQALVAQARRPTHALFALTEENPVVAIGLRDPADDAPMQWVGIGRDEPALAFALRTGLPPVFRTLHLRIDGSDLVPDWPEAGEHGRYSPLVR